MIISFSRLLSLSRARRRSSLSTSSSIGRANQRRVGGSIPPLHRSRKHSSSGLACGAYRRILLLVLMTGRVEWPKTQSDDAASE
jgi:hypothetical protein